MFRVGVRLPDFVEGVEVLSLRVVHFRLPKLALKLERVRFKRLCVRVGDQVVED